MANKLATTSTNYKLEIVWKNVTIMLFVHLGALYGIYLVLSGRTKLTTYIWLWALKVSAGLGVTAGTHRLWAHRSYKATWQLRTFLMLCQTLAYQNHIYEWVRDHRVHHKFTDTDADPHNSTRGFFFSHVGWLLVRKHADVKEKGRTVDMEDVSQDAIVMFQKRHYLLLIPVAFLFPALVPYYFFGESFWTSWWVCCILRYAYTLNVTWLVNSAAHIYGYRPYDKKISAAENITVGFLALGEGWHNYHHVFPWDYKAAELPRYDFNFTLRFIDAMAKIGWAYDLKTVSPELVANRIGRTGSFQGKENIWGWDDKDITENDIACCK